MLAFLAHAAAKIPFEKLSEPLTLLYHINRVTAACGEGVLSSIRSTDPAEVSNASDAAMSGQCRSPAEHLAHSALQVLA